MDTKAKKFTLATISALSLLGAGIITANQVSASENIVLGRDSHGSDINPNSGPFTAGGLRVVGIKGTFATPDKQAIVDRINAIRKEAYDEGLVDRYVPVKWSTSLEQASLRRAAEATMSKAHHRMTGEQLYAGVYSDNFAHLAGNLAYGSETALKAVELFYEEKQNLKTGSGETGHYRHMIDPEWTTVAMSTFTKSNSTWPTTSQLFANNSGDSESLIGEYGATTVYIGALKSKLSDFGLKQNISIKLDSTYSLNLTAKSTQSREITSTDPTVIIPTNRDWSSTDTSVATIDSDGQITAHKEGITTIKVSSDGKTYTTTVTIINPNSTNDSHDFFNNIQDFVKNVGFWRQSGSRWWFMHFDGSYPYNQWAKLDNIWYHFDGSGWMQTGWIKDNGTWYYLDGSGAMKTGWVKDNGSWYYLQDSGAMKTGWMKVSGKWYYAYSSGALAINTTTPDGYRVNANGEWV